MAWSDFFKMKKGRESLAPPVDPMDGYWQIPETAGCLDEIRRFSKQLEESTALQRGNYDQAWADIFHSGRELIIGQDEYGKTHKDRFWELLNAVALLIENKPEAMLLEFGASEFSALYKKFFPGIRLHLSDRPTSADYIGFTARVCHDISGCSAFYPIDLEDAGFVEQFPELSGRYDLIIFTEVLEHLVINPVELLQRLLALLRPGGHLYLTTPNFFCQHNLEQIARRENPQQVYPAANGNWDAHFHHREYGFKELLRMANEAAALIKAGYFSACWDTETDIPVDARGNIVLVLQKPHN